MIRKIELYIFIAVVFSSCNNETEIHFQSLKMRFPSDWRIEYKKSIDAIELGEIITTQNDTLFFECSPFANSLSGNFKLKSVYLSKYKSQILANIDTANSIFVEDIDDLDGELYGKQSYQYIYVQGRRLKIVLPRFPPKEITGFYMNNINMDKEKSNRIHFSLFGRNLKKKTSDQILSIINTVKFDDKQSSSNSSIKAKLY